jgi:glutamine synthetase
LRDESGTNVFYDKNDPHKMSDTFRHYLAGVMHCLPEILPMLAPTVNSYKRLVEGYWAPTSVTWGIDNRTVALRVIPGSPKSTRLELRVGGSDINAYLGVAATLAAGLYGIENKLELKDAPVKGNGYAVEGAVKLPGDLYHAATKMKESTIAKELFGAEFVEHFANTRLWEWRESQKAVTDWELKRYFEII